jgi:hypothetical protein
MPYAPGLIIMPTAHVTLALPGGNVIHGTVEP